MKQINLYGTGENALKYIVLNKSTINIVKVISNDQYLESSFCGIQVCRFNEALSDLNQRYTVVAASVPAYYEIKQKLQNTYGLVEFYNFEHIDTYGKKKAFVYGNCHTGPIIEMLRYNRFFAKDYGIYPLLQIQEIRQRDGINDLMNHALQYCDLFIHQCIFEKNIYGDEYSSQNLIRFLPNKCIVIGIPNLYRMPLFLYPQMPGYDNQIMHEGYNYFPFRDTFIDNNQSQTDLWIAKNIESEDIYKKDIILEGQELFWEKLLNRENDWDITISDYIKENFRNEQTFFDPNHPTNKVLNEISRRILLALNMDDDCRYDRVDSLDSFELPIYGCVRRALGLEFMQMQLRKTGRKLKANRMGLEEYVHEYRCWIKLQG